MKTSRFLIISMLSASFICSCSNDEELVTNGSEDVIEVSAGIGEPTRAVIEAGYGQNLDISFARMDDPTTNGSWVAINAVRVAGSNNTAISFANKQTYLDDNGQSALIGYYPQAVLTKNTNPATIVYTITGDNDIMATEVQTGATNKHFTSFTFQHLLTQLQFKCTGSTDAIAKWTTISSIKVKNVATLLSLSLDNTDGASLTAGSTNQELLVMNCPTEVSLLTEIDPKIGYLMLYPEANMGTITDAITLEVKATYDGTEKTLSVPINNIDGGVKAGESHLITLNFTVDGEINIEASIAEWQPGNNGSSDVVPQ